MDANWFNALFDDQYDNVMNNVVRYVSDGFAGRSIGCGFGGSIGASNGNNTDDDNDDDKNQYDDDDEGELFWLRNVIAIN